LHGLDSTIDNLSCQGLFYDDLVRDEELAAECPTSKMRDVRRKSVALLDALDELRRADYITQWL